MASPQTHLFSLLLFLLLSFTSFKTHSQSHPKSLVLPISKHALTLQYITQINQRTPLVPLNLVIDLSGPFLWVSCDSTYISSSYISSLCNSSLCSLAHLSKPICRNTKKCILFSENVFTTKVSHSYLSQDVLSLHSTNGLNPLSLVSLPHFPFLCAPKFLLQGLASGTKGIAGLGNTLFGLPPQLSSALNFPRKFSICLPPSTNSNGVIFFGHGPYIFSPGIDVSKLLIRTPLIIKPNMATSNYYIIAKSIRVNGKTLPTNSSLVKISTINPYTIIETSMYNSLTDMFIQETIATNVTRVAPVAPFDVCFSTKNDNGGLITRPAFPVIDLILQDERVFWRIFETNSMVVKGDDIACLGLLDGGYNMKSSIVLGGFQLEDNLVQFDLGSSTLGFTNSLLLRQTSCSDFNFTFDG